MPWQGGVFHLGLGKVDFDNIVALHAPLPARFGETDEDIEKHLATMERRDACNRKE